ncbi:hypothetical protein BC834DRAFT_842600 [Gloeopeniophorella convolvens]|nr:hypothetical protein BC834DRAFT_842600 [Gloeopeniophorella convolvens]
MALPQVPPLPVELFEAISAQVESPSDLLRLRLTNSALCALATPRAFRSIRVVNKSESVERLMRILEHNAFSRHVREVVYQYEEATSGELFLYGLRGIEAVHWVQTFSRLARLPTLESLVLNFGTHYEPIDFDPTTLPPEVVLQVLTFTALLSNASALSPSLKTLKMNKLVPMQDDRLHSQSVATFFGDITSLVIDTTLPFPHHPLMDERWVSLSSESIFHPGVLSSSLVSLTMHHVVLRSATAPIPFADVHLPHLEHLSLQRLYFFGEQGVEAFILRHGATLTELQLFLCPMLTATTNIRHPASRFWSEVWARFVTGLRVLEHLVISERRDSRGHAAMDISEWYYFNPYEGDPLTVTETVTADDDAALKHLYEVMGSRSAARRMKS